MAIQTATTGQLENAQRIAITQCLYTAEHNAPVASLVEHFRLSQGEKQINVPKAGQMTAAPLTDGVDMVDSESIGMTITELTTGEVGLKVILTDKLVRQENEDVFKMVGRQMGDAMARKKDRDLIALFAGLNGGTVLGVDNKYLSAKNATACVTFATANKFPSPVAVVHHPNAIGYLASDIAGPWAATYFGGIMEGYSEETLRNFWGMRINGINFFHDGNIDVVTTYESGLGAIFSKSAMCICESLTPTVRRQEDISLRGTEMVLVADYGVFELDDSYGAPMQYEIIAMVSTN